MYVSKLAVSNVQKTSLSELAVLFLRLGVTAFGGPAAHIAMMEDEVVRRRRWLTREAFVDLLGITNLLPGPNSTEMAIHIGLVRAGGPGLVVAGVCFILPAALIVGILAWVYVQFGTLPQVEAAFYGIKPVIIAIVGQALWRLGRTVLKTPLLIALAVAATALSLAGVDELVLLFAAGGLVTAARRLGTPQKLLQLAPWPLVAPLAAAPAVAGTAVGLWPLFLIFLKIGSVLFGSGYVLLAFLRTELVEKTGWLSEVQLLDAVAVGQFTPGPVFTTATFVGYLLGGAPGAAVATLGIFLPAFIFVALAGWFAPRIGRSPSARAFLDGLNVASLALMAAVTFELAGAAIVDIPTAVLAALSAVLLVRWGWNSAWLVLIGAAMGLVAAAGRVSGSVS
ncbi:MAG: chromate efflux transporter [Aphanocapsa lilacina HA4352-LM1]|nr:chromate efflux transporter [Aphanocapsa lilacina HA4352-LM1]